MANIMTGVTANSGRGHREPGQEEKLGEDKEALDRVLAETTITYIDKGGQRVTKKSKDLNPKEE